MRLAKHCRRNISANFSIDCLSWLKPLQVRGFLDKQRDIFYCRFTIFKDRGYTMHIKKIGILTSGGDTPGMNACIHVIARAAIAHGVVPFGVQKGYRGLIDGQISELSPGHIDGISSKGGTILKTARCLEMKTAEGQKTAAEALRAFGIDGLIVIGGDGSMRGASVLSEMGIPVMCLPGTIDNDLAYTEYSIGFDSAVNCAIWEIERIKDTMASHERIAVVEVMGNKCGDIALLAGIATEAAVILVPEMKYNLDSVCELLLKKKATGEYGGIVVMAEGAGKIEEIAQYLFKHTNIELRTNVFGICAEGRRAHCLGPDPFF